LNIATRALGFIIAAIVVTGCGGSSAQSGVVEPPAYPAALPAGAKSWMSPAAEHGDLLYADAGNTNGNAIYVFTYPGGKLVGTIHTNIANLRGLCSDAKGNVFVVADSNAGSQDAFIYEYARGGTTPIRTLPEGEVGAIGCAVDRKSGDLAVASANVISLASYVEVYRHAEGTPALYSDQAFPNYNYCAYDDRGNLYFDGDGGPANGTVIGEIPRGSTTTVNYTLAHGLAAYGQMLWDGRRMTVASWTGSPMYRLRFSASRAEIAQTIHLQQSNPGAQQAWVQGHTLIAPYESGVGLWNYPAGGRPATIIKTPLPIYGVTISSVDPRT
jgi:hypothetical protein